MKRTLLLIAGYYLIIQSACGAFVAIGTTDYLIPIWIISGLFGYCGYWLIKKARPQPPAQVVAPKAEDD